MHSRKCISQPWHVFAYNEPRFSLRFIAVLVNYEQFSRYIPIFNLLTEQVACMTISRQLITTKTFALQAKTGTIDSKKNPIYC